MQKTDQTVLSPENDIKRWWNDHAKYWKETKLRPVDELYKRQFKEQLGNDTKKALDIGTGGGLMARALAELGHEVTGLDLCENMLAVTKQSFKETGTEIKLAQATGTKLPFVDNAFDVIVSRSNFSSMLDQNEALREWIRVTKNGGRVIMFNAVGNRGLKISLYNMTFGRYNRMRQWLRMFKRAHRLPRSEDFGYSKETDRKLRSSGLKPKTIKGWQEYFSKFSVTQVNIKIFPLRVELHKVKNGANGESHILSRIDYYLYTGPLMVSFVVQKPNSGRSQFSFSPSKLNGSQA